MLRWLLMLVSSAKAQMRQLGQHLSKSLHVPSPCLKSISPPHAPSDGPNRFQEVLPVLCLLRWMSATPPVCLGSGQRHYSAAGTHAKDSLAFLAASFIVQTHCSRADEGTWLTATGAGDVSSDEPSSLAGMIKPHIFDLFDQNTDSYSLNGVWFAPNCIKPYSSSNKTSSEELAQQAVGVSTHHVRNQGNFRAQCELNSPI